jgi:hypothetical protein
MKKLLLSVILAAFAVAVQASDTKSACSDKEGSCCAGAKATEQTKAQCSMAKQAKAGTCSMTGKVATKEVKPVLQSPKALADAR